MNRKGQRLAPVSFDEPVCLIAAARFPSPVTARSLWDAWSETTPLLAHLSQRRGPQLFAQGLMRGFMASASRVHAFAVPVTELSDELALVSQLVEPAIWLVATVDA